MNNPKNSLISIRNLSFSYEEGNEVLKDINLEIPRGIILGLVGPNGGGKTTLLKIILGLLKGYSGEVITHCALRDDEKGHHSCVGYVPQRSYINRNFPATVYDTVEMGLYGFTGFRKPNKKEKEYINWLLKEVDIESIKNSSINEISGGQLQKALIARALVAKPSLLFLDEPLVGVDQKGTLMFVELLFNLKKLLDLTVVIVSHDFRAIKMCADKVACLNNTIHFHDNSQRITLEELSRFYSCGYEAYKGLQIVMNQRGSQDKC